MSVHAISWVLRHSDEQLANRLVLLVLADHAEADGTEAYPSVRTIAREARVSERAVHYCLRQLEASGAIVRAGVSRKRTTIYSVTMRDTANPAPCTADGEGCNPRQPRVQSATGEGEAVSPEPSIEPSLTVHTSSTARARAPDQPPVFDQSRDAPDPIDSEDGRVVAIVGLFAEFGLPISAVEVENALARFPSVPDPVAVARGCIQYLTHHRDRPVGFTLHRFFEHELKPARTSWQQHADEWGEALDELMREAG